MSSSRQLQILLDKYGMKEVINDLLWNTYCEYGKNKDKYFTKLNEIDDHFVSRIKKYKEGLHL